jgi:Ca2+-binding EF-hand superfamily protein
MGLNYVLILSMVLAMAGGLIQPASLGAQGKGPPVEMIKSAYQEILRACDANKDGQLSAQECLGAWKDKAKAEKECKYWDANGDGAITEGEYVDQVRKIMK